MRFLVISDVHFDDETIESQRPIQPFVDRVVSDSSIDFGVITGDLTNNGNDGTVTCGCLWTFFGSNTIITGGSTDNQLQKFIDTMVAPIDKIKKPLFLIPGNHDQYNGASRYPVNDYIKKRHGNTHYLIERDGNALIFCDIYPDTTVCSWLANIIRTNNYISRKIPCLIFFHYNLCDLYSDWWTDAEKENFASTIKGLKVLGIFVGHYHESYTYLWNNYNVYDTAGALYADCIVTNGQLTVNFNR